ncbi:AMP-binding protein [Brevibacterium sp. 50QC2O2]|uniref:AMP-binding protein n=1 Tax=Brevibacterium TaxID=1696 RepID=UPI00211C1449|nr:MULTISPECIES: AMP-binding protein [unclassified Brevibacterium]MCQ9385176.1 AMP-binding protein [Brevibacterium sp. 68QC2CO]MCQ9387799.1 AMP-binding protein [Brevibacterium sp. 50QC2O2]
MTQPAPDTSTGIPTAVRRNHWNQQILGHARVRPDVIAFKHRGVPYTWGRINQLIEHTAAALDRRGVGHGDRIATLALNHIGHIVAAMAANRLGAIFVPINTRLTTPEIAYILDDADANTVFVDPALLPRITDYAQAAGRAAALSRILVFDSEVPGETGLAEAAIAAAPACPPVLERHAALAAEDPADFIAPDVAEYTTCMIMYTSGTTGRPKGAMLDYMNMVSQANTIIRVNEVRTDDVCFVTAPFFHTASWGNMAGNITMGATSVIHPLGAFNPVEVLDAYEAEGANFTFNVPQQWQQLCDARDAGRPGGGDWDLALRVICWGAAPASENLLRHMARSFPGTNIVAALGQTEMSPVTCSLSGPDSLRKIGSIGKPLPTLQTRIVDPAMNDVTPGEVGELVYQGPNLMQGYWRKPEETAKAFTGGWFHSGDLVRADDEGFLYIVDRAKDMIISGGENIYCTEVENVLFDHPAVLEAAVYRRPDERWGEVPIAAVALREGAQLTLDELRTWLDDRLARFKQPKDLVFVDTLPRNASGKVRKVDLRQAQG